MDWSAGGRWTSSRREERPSRLHSAAIPARPPSSPLTRTSIVNARVQLHYDGLALDALQKVGGGLRARRRRLSGVCHLPMLALVTKLTLSIVRCACLTALKIAIGSAGCSRLPAVPLKDFVQNLCSIRATPGALQSPCSGKAFLQSAPNFGFLPF